MCLLKEQMSFNTIPCFRRAPLHPNWLDFSARFSTWSVKWEALQTKRPVIAVKLKATFVSFLCLPFPISTLSPFTIFVKVSENGRNVKWFVKSQYLCLCTIFRFYVWPALPVLHPTFFLKWPQQELILIKIIIICWSALGGDRFLQLQFYLSLDTEHRQLSLI